MKHHQHLKTFQLQGMCYFMSDKLSSASIFKNELWSIRTGDHAELVNKQIQIKPSEQMYSGMMINDYEDRDGSIG